MSPSFADLGVPKALVSALAQQKIAEPFPIQAKAIAPALAGRDVCGRAPTGSGKTLAFGIPLVVDLPSGRKRHPSALVLSPTRELADQIGAELKMLGRPLGVSVLTVYGGVGYGPQRNGLQRGVDVVVACPGRLEDLIAQGVVDLSQVERVVVDEADRMADMGFMPAVRRILDGCSHERQTMLFSATLEGATGELQRRYQRDAVFCEVDDAADEPDLDHSIERVDREKRLTVTADLVRRHGPTIVFCRTRRGVDRVARQLDKAGLSTAAIHGDRSQRQRTRALESFAAGRSQALVATDVAARGIHVDDVACVIHYDPPADAETYVHRSGRTGRAGRTGTVVSLVTDSRQQREAGQILAACGVDRANPARQTPRVGGTPKDAVLQGEVKFFHRRRGFGFILHDDGELFVHQSHVTGPLRAGQPVRFELGQGPRGPEAQKVSALTG